jgi:hypothetical protein
MNKILIGGDFYLSDEFIGIGEGMWGELEGMITDADAFILNVEAPLTTANNEINKTGPAIKMNPDLLEQMIINPNTIATLANNHIKDFGDQGILDTLQYLNARGIKSVGAGSNIDEARKALRVNIGSKIISIINTCESEWCGVDESAGANTLHLSSLYNQIKTSKLETDFVFVIIHGGSEYYSLPSPKRQELYRLIVDFGADAIVSHHSHCVSGYEYYKGSPIIYSIGNLIFPIKKSNLSWNLGFLAEFTLEGDEFKFNPVPYFFGNNSELRFLTTPENDTFHRNQNYLNGIISSPSELQKEWLAYCKTQSVGIINFILWPRIVNFVLRKLGISLRFSKIKFRLLNYLRCESHLDVLSTAIENEIKNNV